MCPQCNSFDVEIEELRAISVNPGDVVMCRVKMMLRQESYNRLVEKLTSLFPNNRCMIVEPCIEIDVHTASSIVNETITSLSNLDAAIPKILDIASSDCGEDGRYCGSFIGIIRKTLRELEVKTFGQPICENNTNTENEATAATGRQQRR